MKNKRNLFTAEETAKVENQIREEQKIVSYDTKEYTVEILIKKFRDGDLFVPDYQRKYIWDEQRKRKFIESLLLGLPIPFLFCADMPNGKLEMIDGVQRVTTLSSFEKDEIELYGLEKLTYLKKQKFSDLPISQQRKFLNRSMRMVVLQESSDEKVRRDIFERINTGSDALTKSELRKGAYQGKFYDFVSEMSKNDLFKELCPIGGKKQKRGEAEELVLRFFAYSEKYLDFKHSVYPFLDEYLKLKNEAFDHKEMEKDFLNMLSFVRDNLPNGFTKSKGAKTTPRVRFEAISVGINLALKQKPKLNIKNLDWLTSNEFEDYTTSDASNSRPKLKRRVEYVRDALLNNN